MRMNIFHKVTLQSMKKSRTRTVVTIIGVILSTAMITAVTTFSVSLLNYMIKGATVKYGGWHVEFVDIDSAFAEEQARAGCRKTAVRFWCRPMSPQTEVLIFPWGIRCP